MFRKNINELYRQTWLKNTLANLLAGSRVLDVGAGELKNRKLCGHLDYVSQDFCLFTIALVAFSFAQVIAHQFIVLQQTLQVAGQVLFRLLPGIFRILVTEGEIRHHHGGAARP